MATEEVPTIDIPDTQMAQDSQAMGAAATQAYTESQVAAQGTDGNGQPASSVGEAFQDAQTPQETQMVTDDAEAAEEDALHRQNAFLEETSMIKCRKCGVDTELCTAIVRGPREMWCRSCNSIYTMLQRNMQWPPKDFEQLDPDRQQGFFQKCAEDKEASKSTCFSYKRVRDVLIKSLVEEEIRQRKVQVGGTYKPKSVYIKKGYILDEDFENRNPRLWSDGLQQWTYLLVEVSIHESEIKQTVERSVVECEKAIKKRKHPNVTAQEMEAVENKSQKTDMVPVMDLISDDEDEEGQVHLCSLSCI